MDDGVLMPEWRRLNRENWDERIGFHAASEFYDLPAFRAGASTLRSFELEEVGDVSGRSLLHLQCHMGQDTLSWAQLGAQTVGLDSGRAPARSAPVLSAGEPNRRGMTSSHPQRRPAAAGRRGGHGA